MQHLESPEPYYLIMEPTYPTIEKIITESEPLLAALKVKISHSREPLPKNFRTLFENPDEETSHLFEARYNGKYVGHIYVGYYPDTGDWTTYEANVEPNYRRQGIATQLYDAAEKFLGEKLVPFPGGHSKEAQRFWNDRLSKYPEIAKILASENVEIKVAPFNTDESKIPDPTREDFTLEAWVNGKKVGYLQAYREVGRLFAFEVDVEPKFRRQGIATKLYDKATELSGKTIYPHEANPYAETETTDEAKKFWEARFGKPWKEIVRGMVLAAAPSGLIQEFTKIFKKPRFYKDWLEYGDDIAGEFGEDYPGFYEPFLIDYETEEDKAGYDAMHINHKAAQKYLKVEFDRFVDRLKEHVEQRGSNVYLYRVIYAKSPEEIKLKNIGIYWASNAHEASSYWGKQDGNRYVVEAEVPISSVDLKLSLMLNLNPHTDEHEIRLKPGAPIKILRIFGGDVEEDPVENFEEAPKKASAYKALDALIGPSYRIEEIPVGDTELVVPHGATTSAAKKPLECDVEDAWQVLESWFKPLDDDLDANDEVINTTDWINEFKPKYLAAIKKGKLSRYPMDKAIKTFKIADYGRKVPKEALDNPIIVATYPGARYLEVLDGSHRLLQRYKSGLKDVAVLLVNLPWWRDDFDAVDAHTIEDLMGSMKPLEK